MNNELANVARAIGKIYDGHVDPNDTPLAWAKAMAAARVGLSTLREPSQDMIRAANATGVSNLLPRWRAIIDWVLR